MKGARREVTPSGRTAPFAPRSYALGGRSSLPRTPAGPRVVIGRASDASLQGTPGNSVSTTGAMLTDTWHAQVCRHPVHACSGSQPSCLSAWCSHPSATSATTSSAISLKPGVEETHSARSRAPRRTRIEAILSRRERRFNPGRGIRPVNERSAVRAAAAHDRTHEPRSRADEHEEADEGAVIDEPMESRVRVSRAVTRVRVHDGGHERGHEHEHGRGDATSRAHGRRILRPAVPGKSRLDSAPPAMHNTRA